MSVHSGSGYPLPALPMPTAHEQGRRGWYPHQSTVRDYLKARHSRLLNQEGDEDEASQALSPRQCNDGVQVAAAAKDGGSGRCFSGVPCAPQNPLSLGTKPSPPTDPLICTLG